MIFNTEILSQSEVIKNYNPDRVYSTVTPGSQIYGNILHLDRENPGLRRMAQVAVYISKTEDITLDQLLKSEEFTKDPKILSDIKILSSEVDRYIKLAKDKDVTVDKIDGYLELQSKLNKYGLALTRFGSFVKFNRKLLKLNSPFFKTASVQLPNSSLDFIINDPDYDRWVSKTWIFTNIKYKKVRALDRSNRPFVVRYRDTTNSDVFDYLGIPENAEGIFVIRDNCAGRSNFTSSIGYHRHLDGQSGLLTLRGPSNYIREKLNISPSDDLKHPMYSSKLKEGQFSPYFNIMDNDFIHGEYNKLIDPSYNLDLNVYMKQAIYPNMTESGPDRAAIALLCRRDINLVSKLNNWKELLEAYFYNDNIEMDNKDAFKYLIRNYLTNVSDKLLMLPTTILEDGLQIEDKLLISREEQFYKMPNSNPGISYRNILLHGEMLKNMSHTIHSPDLYRVQENLDKHMSFRNALTFQDIIFIPIEKIELNNNAYYCSKSDYMFLLERDISTTDVVHPYSTAAIKTNIEEESGIGSTNTSVNIEVYSNQGFNRNQMLYTKVFGEVISIYIKPSDIIGESDYIKRSYRTHTGELKVEKFDYTKENLEKLDLFYSNTEAKYHGITPDEIDKVSLINKMKLTELQGKKEKLKAINEYNTFKHNLILNKRKEIMSSVEFRRDMIKIRSEIKKHILDYQSMLTKASIEEIKMENKSRFSKTETFIESVGNLAGVLKSGNDLFTSALRIINTVIDYKNKNKNVRDYYGS